MKPAIFSILILFAEFLVNAQNTDLNQNVATKKSPKYFDLELSLSPFIWENNNKIIVESRFSLGIGSQFDFFISKYNSVIFGLSIKRAINSAGIEIDEERYISKLTDEYYTNNIYTETRANIFIFNLPVLFNFFLQEFDDRYPNFYVSGGANFILRQYEYFIELEGYYKKHNNGYLYYDPFSFEFSDYIYTFQMTALLAGGLIFPVSRTVLFNVGIEGGYGTGNTIYTSAYGRIKFKL